MQSLKRWEIQMENENHILGTDEMRRIAKKFKQNFELKLSEVVYYFVSNK